MDSRMAYQSTQASALQTNKVLRNTYSLLAMTLAFAAVVAGAAIVFNLPPMHWIVMLAGFYGLLFWVSKASNSSTGLIAVFALTGFLGYSAGTVVGMVIGAGGGEVVMTALGGTALAFFGLSAYALTTKRDLSFLNGMMVVGFWVLIACVIANIFLAIPALALAISAMFILFSSGAILLQTQAIIKGGETNYIMATVTLFVSIYNIFMSLIHILMAFAGGNDD